MQSSNLTFEKIETPGWSSLVESDISEKKQHQTKEDILSKLVSLNDKTYEEVDRGRPLRRNGDEMKSVSNLPKHNQTSKLAQNGNISQVTNRPKVYIVDKQNVLKPLNRTTTNATATKQQPRPTSSTAKKTGKRWREIDVY